MYDCKTRQFDRLGASQSNFLVSSSAPRRTCSQPLAVFSSALALNCDAFVFDINVWGVLNSMRHEIPAMLKNGGGAIVNTSAVAGHVGMGQVSILTASKHAVEGLTKALALEFAKQNIRINAVAPAGVATDMVDRFAGKEGEMRDYFTSLHPVGRIGTSEEIAAAVLYLCSDDAKFTTGTSLVVDGGMLAQ